ncbi:hypothetical protein ACHQM5_012867 [Ranunculus cassubicifolius]
MAHQYIFSGLLSLFLFPILITALSKCSEPCQTGDDCYGQLTCVSGVCTDDPDVGTNICSSTPIPKPPTKGSGGCQPSGTLACGTKIYPTYTCSPNVTASTRAILNYNDFSEGGDGGSPSECDESYHEKNERVVSLSTGWYAGGSRCGKMITITASNGRTSTAMVVDECDSRKGCDREHAGQPPCDNNIVNGSDAVWADLGLDIDVGEVIITWSMA